MQSLNRVAAELAALPPGATPPGTAGSILHAALQRFAKWGFHGTSIREIAADVGINSATLYAHFPSKEDILRELVMIGHTELDSRLTAALAQAETPRDQLAVLVRADVESHASYPLLAVVTNSELHALSPDAAAPALAIRRRLRALAVDIMREGIESGQFRTTTPDLAVQAMADMIIRIGNWFPGEAHDVEAVASAYVDLALRMADAR